MLAGRHAESARRRQRAARLAAGGTWPTPRSGCPSGAPRADAPGRPRTPAAASPPASARHRGAAPAPRRDAAGSGHQQHDQPVPCRPARPQQRDDLLIAGAVDRRLRLAQPMPGSHPPHHAAFLVPGLLRQITVVGHLIQQRHQTRPAFPGRDRVHHHPPHRSQHVDPAWASHVMKQGELPGTGLPGPARPCAPAQEQRDRVPICLRRGLRPVAAEPLMPQEPIGDVHYLQILIQHRPVPLPGRQPHRKRPHPSIPRSRAGLPAHLPATSTTPT